MSSLRHRTHLTATISKICTGDSTSEKRHVTLAKGIHFTASKTQLEILSQKYQVKGAKKAKVLEG